MNSSPYQDNVNIPMDDAIHLGILRLPANTQSLVLFVHGSGSSRLSSRNNYVAEVLAQQGIGSLLFDLLTEQEDQIYANRFDIALLTERLIQATQWAQQQPDTQALTLGYFGASTGAAAALIAAAELSDTIGAVVSRGGRPDLAMTSLPDVKAPTLLIVGGLDDVVIDLNKQADQALSCEKQLSIVPGASHLFEEPGTLEKAAKLAADWFSHHLQ